MTNRLYASSIYLASLTEGVMPSARLLQRLLDLCGSPEAVWRQWSPALLSRALPTARAAHWIEKPTHWQTDDHLQTTANKLAATQTHVVYPVPERLQALGDPPVCLYARGNVALLDEPTTLGIVGTRMATDYSQRVIGMLLKGLTAYQPVIISGLAAGVDGMAHQAALDYGLPTIAVMGTGLDTIYPAHHARLAQQILEADGLLLSEYPMAFGGDKFTFPARNRIIAGLSQGVLVTECPIRSGAMITARVALDNGRDVLAVPGSLFDPNAAGPNQLIAQGATPVLDANSIVSALGWQARQLSLVDFASAGDKGQTKTLASKATNPLNPSASRMVLHEKTNTAKRTNGRAKPQITIPASTSRASALPANTPADLQAVWSLLSDEPMTVDALAQLLAQSSAETSISPRPLQVCLTLLELDGHICQLPGQQVVRA